ncbi:MAG TPA: hypothetical protein VE422_30715 [Terriglobia bacterium]|nr:hypothetical protein [Terriglobia bacterium]
MRTEVAKRYKFYIQNSSGEYLRSRHVKRNGARFTPHTSHATWSESKETAEQLVEELHQLGQSDGIQIVFQEYEYSYSQPEEAELLRLHHFELGTKRLISAVENISPKKLPVRIAQHLGWEGKPPDWINDANAFMRGFNRWREQADLDFLFESSQGPVFHCTLTDKWRNSRDDDREWMISSKGKTVLEAGCRAWLKTIITVRRKRQAGILSRSIGL